MRKIEEVIELSNPSRRIIWDKFESMEDLLQQPFSRDATKMAEWAWGGDEPKQVLERLRNGATCPKVWKHFLNEQGVASKYLAELEHVDRTRRFEHRWAECGDEIDAGRMLAGEEKCWREIHRGKRNPIIRLGIGTTMSSGHSSQTFAVWIARAAALVDSLMVRGYGVEVVAIGAHTESSSYYISTCPLKGAHEPLDPARLCSIGTVALCRVFTNQKVDSDPRLQFRYCGYPCLDATVRQVVGVDTALGQCIRESKTGWEAIMPFLTTLANAE